MTRGGYSMGMTAFVTLAAMSVDRCLAIRTKARYKTLVTKKRTTFLVVFLWIFASLATVSGLQLLDSRNKFGVVFAVAVIFLLVIAISYSFAFWDLKKLSTQISNKSSLPTTTPTPLTSCYNVIKYKRSLLTVIMILVLNLTVYLPMLFLSIATVSITVHNSVVVFQYVGLLLSLNSTVNPIFYLWRMTDLRKATKAIFCTCSH
jgi:hypothetical protein